MRLAFYTDEGSPRNLLLAEALRAGGLDVDVFDESEIRFTHDLHSFVGVVANRELVDVLRAGGLPFLYWDKGYTRDWPHRWRVSFSSRQPLSFLTWSKCPPDRAEALGWLRDCRAWRSSDEGYVLFTGAEERYHAFHDLPAPSTYAEKIIHGIRKRTRRPVVYRPRPKWLHVRPIAGALLSSGRVPIAEDLLGAHCHVTHGSNTCLDALFAGVPSIVLGDGVTRHISSTDLDDLEAPRIPSDEERVQLLSNLAYTQWTLDEMRSGQAWQFIRNHLCV